MTGFPGIILILSLMAATCYFVDDEACVCGQSHVRGYDISASSCCTL